MYASVSARPSFASAIASLRRQGNRIRPGPGPDPTRRAAPGAGRHRGALSVFPIWQHAQRTPAITLAHELSITVGELDSPQVPWLQVEAADRPVLLLEHTTREFFQRVSAWSCEYA